MSSLHPSSLFLKSTSSGLPQVQSAFRSNDSQSQRRFILIGAIIATILVFIIVLSRALSSSTLNNIPFSSIDEKGKRIDSRLYDSTPLSNTDNSYQILAIADLDTDSYDPVIRVGKSDKPRWSSRIKQGTLIRNINPTSIDKTYSIRWDTIHPEKKVYGILGESGRGMELSEVVKWLGKMYAFDDRTGTVYELVLIPPNTEPTVIPRFILVNGDGTPSSSSKGFKSEWAAVKDGSLYIGSMGREYTTPNGDTLLSNAPMWVKRILPNGHIQHINWEKKYNKLRKSIPGTTFPGYILHEAVEWSDLYKRWIFAPRRVSTEQYDDVQDEHRGSNIILITDSEFDSVSVYTVGTRIPERGFSSIKLIPGTRDQHILALKTYEVEGKTETYAMVFDWTTRQVLMSDTMISSDLKYEGIEFV